MSTPILIALPCADPLDPPYALDPLNAAVSIATAPTAAINRYRLTTSLLAVMPAIDQATKRRAFSSRLTG